MTPLVCVLSWLILAPLLIDNALLLLPMTLVHLRSYNPVQMAKFEPENCRICVELS